MSYLGRKTFAIIICAFVVSLTYYGSYLPLRKSRAFIRALHRMGTVKTFSDFKEVYAKPLDMLSPVGQEELVRNMTNTILNLVQGGRTSPDLTKSLTNFAEEYYAPIINRGKGMSFEQNLYLLGALNEFAFIQTKEPKYFAAAKYYHTEGYRLGSRRPQALYGLFDIYRIEGNIEGAKRVAEQILNQWPEDGRTGKELEEFLARQSQGR